MGADVYDEHLAASVVIRCIHFFGNQRYMIDSNEVFGTEIEFQNLRNCKYDFVNQYMAVISQAN